MRILLLHHFPLREPPLGALVSRWSRALVAAGCDVRLLTVDNRREPDEVPRVDRVVCSASEPAAELPFELPRFANDLSGGSANTFSHLSDAELAQYRHVLRRRLDDQVVSFNPHLIHAQHAWIMAQLALESGVPYLVNVWGPELDAAQEDNRYSDLAEQAAVNAACILCPDPATLDRVTQRLEPDPQRAIVAPAALQADAQDSPREVADDLLRLYQAVVEARPGSSP